ncbi:MAG: hypothetical protein JWR39_1983 [Devosia sp.]|jgi:hypothetical protein|nr:hypothetical protein [Devosia sp.]
MRTKSLISALALVSAMTFTGSAMAQTTSAPTMFGGTELSADDLPAVQERCMQLTTASTTESLSENTDSDDDTNEDPGSPTDGGATPQIENPPVANEVENATTGIDLDTITLEQCEEAGIGE